MSLAEPRLSRAGTQVREPAAAAWPIETWAGEVRVNLIRLVAIVLFYGHHLSNVYFLADDPKIRGSYHVAVTALVIVWSATVMLLYFCLAQRWMPPWLKYAATLTDVVMITGLLMLTGDAKSMLAALYFLVIAAAPLRLSLPLVYVATGASMGGYLYFLGYLRYWLNTPDQERLTRPNQIIFVLGLLAAGLLAGQVVRQIRRIAKGYPVVAEGP